MNSILLFTFLTFDLISSTLTTVTMAKIKLMSAKMLGNISSNEKGIFMNDDGVKISEQGKLTGISRVLTH